MLPKKNRADKKTVESIFKASRASGREGKSVSSPSFTFKFILKAGPEKKISFIVPKNVSKLAVKRNLLRRLGYSALRKRLPGLPDASRGIAGIFVFKRYEDDASIIENEIKDIFNKIH